MVTTANMANTVIMATAMAMGTQSEDQRAKNPGNNAMYIEFGINRPSWRGCLSIDLQGFVSLVVRGIKAQCNEEVS